MVSRMKTSPKAFFAYARARQQTRAKIGPFIDTTSGLPNPDPDFTAEQLSKPYSSVFVQPRTEWSVPSPSEFFAIGSTENNITDFTFTEQDIENACKELNPDSAPGPDGIPAELLRTARAELARPLHILWRASLDNGSIPPELLLVQVCPLHKGGSRSAAKNYRPVALTSHMTKVFERVMRKVLVSHLEEHSHLPDGQHGFRAGRSCLTQLLYFWDTLLEERRAKVLTLSTLITPKPLTSAKLASSFIDSGTPASRARWAAGWRPSSTQPQGSKQWGWTEGCPLCALSFPACRKAQCLDLCSSWCTLH